MIAMPITRLMTAVASLLSQSTGRLSGTTTASAVSSIMIQLKNVWYRGVETDRSCIRPVAASATTAATTA